MLVRSTYSGAHAATMIQACTYGAADHWIAQAPSKRPRDAQRESIWRGTVPPEMRRN